MHEFEDLFVVRFLFCHAAATLARVIHRSQSASARLQGVNTRKEVLSVACQQGKWAARHQAAVEGDRVARITRVTLVDDLDGGEASETVYFSFEGRHYEIDLTAQNAAKLRDSLAPFVAAARRRDGARRSRTARADPGRHRPAATV